MPTLSLPLAACALATCAAALPLSARQDADGGEWRHYGGDKASTKYSPLDQIDGKNVGQLELAWSWASIDDEIEPKVRGAGHFKATPVMVGGRLYFTTSLQQVVAVDAGTGESIWVHDPKVYAEGRPVNSGFQHRGVEYWSDGERERLFVANGLRQLLSLDARTGELDPAFGQGGVVDTTVGLARPIARPNEYGHNAPPIVCAGTIVLGSIVSDGPTRKTMPPGDVRGYDPVTGALRWTFHTVPQEGEHGNETWENGSWREAGNTNVWSMLSCDDELGYVYLPLSTPTNDWYGGHRLGDNLFAESLVALDARTGERKWHFQAVHHGLWDYDFPCAPNLVDITVDGKRIPAVAQVSKQGFTYVFDRRTGEPVWPIEERPVPQTRVPGERTSPTQPFPTKPPPFERQGFTLDDVIDFTPELRAEALKILEEYELGPIFTPPSVVGENGKKAVLMLPSAAGGANWRGAAIDPETGVLFVPSMTLAMELGVGLADPARSEFTYVYAASFLPKGPQGLPLTKPPYGRITAIDLNRGEHLWQVADGPGPQDHPAIAHLDMPNLGNSSHGVLSNGGLLLTKTLLFAIQAKLDESTLLRQGKEGWIRAYDKQTGAKVWEREVVPTPHGSPMTYSHGGKQYLVVAAGGMVQPAQLLAFALP
ncbi:MAG TPA: pyrroloquinoline quinone-dependent dehydrogenase [Thermoanaerobaculia bacterium]|nr:pyrroloquinoline quinone-dependent dehydrogenase [Thermoanaerobaculia bacterium]